MTNYAQLAGNMAAAEDRGVWIMPLSPNYFLIEPEFYAMDFALTGEADFALTDKADFAGIPVDPAVAGEQLARALAGKDTAQLVRAKNSDRFPEAGYILDDPKHLIKFLLDKYGVLAAERDSAAVGMPYLVYQLPEQADYAVFGSVQPEDTVFDGKVTLTEVSFGRTAQANAGVNVNEHTLPSGEPLWVTLRWRADAPIDVDLKTSLSLRDGAGHIAGQVDDLLVSDRYPVQRVWEAGEESASYHILPVLPGVAPGRYEIVLRVYEDQTQRPYAVLDAGGKPLGTDTVIGSVEITPAQGPQALAPQQPATGATQITPDLALLGYDLPSTGVAPGGSLPLTLFWQAAATPPADYDVKLQLRSTEGDVVTEQVRPVAGGAYPTSQWRAGTSIRDWQDMAVETGIAHGSYRLWLALMDGEQRLGEVELGEITVAGRAHAYGLPPMALPATATFGQSVQLAGLETAPAATVQPGKPIELPLVWQVVEPAERPLVRFVHLLGANGELVAQVDSIPCSGTCPSNTWVAGEVVRDTVALTVPEDAAVGKYTLATGWYDGETLQRLEARDEQGVVLADGLAPLLDVEVSR
jgi:hypothetical protein